MFGSFEGRGGLVKKGSGKKIDLWEGKALGGLVFFIIQNPPNLGN